MSRHFRRTFNVFLAVGNGHRVRPRHVVHGGRGRPELDVDTATANGSGPVVLFTQARIGALQMMADDELTLLTRDSVPTYQPDYDKTVGRFSRLLASASNGAGSVEEGQIKQRGDRARGVRPRSTGRSGKFDEASDVNLQDEAVALASGSGPNQLPTVSSNLDSNLGGAITHAQQTFNQWMSRRLR